MSNDKAPARIWAYGGECSGYFVRGWDKRSLEPSVEYIRADLYQKELELFRKTLTDTETIFEQRIAELEAELRHCSVFIRTREKMHPDGIALFDELLEQTNE